MVSKKVVVTGMEMITSLGLDKETTFNNLCKSTVIEKSRLEIEKYKTKDYIKSSIARKMSSAARNGLVASIKALEDSHIKITPENSRRIGIVTACAFGAGKTMDKYLTAIEKLGGSKASPINFVSIMHQETAAQLSINLGIKGFHMTLATMGSGLAAISCAVDMIRCGRVDTVIVCGSEEISPTVWDLGLEANFFTKDEDGKSTELFSKRSTGSLYGEGAGVLILEDKETAKKRNAKVLGEIKAYGSYNYAKGNMYIDQDGTGLTNSIQKALSISKFNIRDIDCIFSSANGYFAIDNAEIQALKQIDLKEEIKITAIKSMLGETFGASSIIQTICALMSINSSKLMPTVRVNDDSAKKLINTKLYEGQINNSLICSTYPSGENSVLIVGK